MQVRLPVSNVRSLSHSQLMTQPAAAPATLRTASAPASPPASRPSQFGSLKLGGGGEKSPGAVDCATPRGSKTPRSAHGGPGGSPNTRRRKSARADLQQPVSPGRPSPVLLQSAFVVACRSGVGAGAEAPHYSAHPPASGLMYLKTFTGHTFELCAVCHLQDSLELSSCGDDGSEDGGSDSDASTSDASL